MSSVNDVFNEFVDYDADVDDLERVVEGRRSGSIHSDDEVVRSDEAEEERPKDDRELVEPKQKRAVKNPRITLNPARLTGPRGIQAIADHFKDFKFKGKGHEKEDLDVIMKNLEHWAHRLYPKFTFDDCLEKIEHLGNKKIVSVHVRKIHLNMLNDMPLNEVDSDDENTPSNPVEVQEKDDFDLLLEQQIALARSTPASGAKFAPERSNITPCNERKQHADTAFDLLAHESNTRHGATQDSSTSLSEEQKIRILKNRQLAEEKRKSKMLPNIQKSPVGNDKENINHSHIVNVDDQETTTNYVSDDNDLVALNRSCRKNITKIIIDDNANDNVRNQNNKDLSKSNDHTTDNIVVSVIDIDSDDDGIIQDPKKKVASILIDDDESTNSDRDKSDTNTTDKVAVSVIDIFSNDNPIQISSKKIANIVNKDDLNNFDDANDVRINNYNSNINSNEYLGSDNDKYKDLQKGKMKQSMLISEKSVDNINIDDNTNDAEVCAKNTNINGGKNSDVAAAFFHDVEIGEVMDID